MFSATGTSPLKRSLKDHVVHGLGSEIVCGRLRPGDVLPSEDVLLAKYDVSRTVLREALNSLSARGLVDARPKRGTVVRPRSEWSQLDPAVLHWSGGAQGSAPDDAAQRLIEQLMQVRRIVEPGGAALAARCRTDGDITLMEASFEGMARAEVAEDFMEADLAFHVACLHAAHNDFLLPVANAIRTAMMTSLRVTNRDPQENRAVSLPLHEAILVAIRHRNPDAARAAMERHLDDTEQRRIRAALAQGT
jgi:DNA-binding FadR family transcriptional regulator